MLSTLIYSVLVIDTPFPTTSLGDDLAQLVNGKEFSDVTFEVGGKQVFAHRAILCAWSEYFRAMFSEASEKFTTVTPVSIFGGYFWLGGKPFLTRNMSPV